MAPGIPIEIKNVHFNPVPGGFTNLTYQIRNNSQEPVQALELFLEVTDGKHISRTPQYIDSWGNPSGGLLAGATREGPPPLSMEATEGGVTSISLTVGAVLFEDGSSVGDDAADFRKFITSQRAGIQAQILSVRALLNSKGIEAVRSMLNEQKNASREQVFANTMLQRALTKDGVSGLNVEITHLSNLRP